MADPPDGAGVQGVRILAAAQNMADRLVADAREQAAKVEGDAEVYRETMVAQLKADTEIARIRWQAGKDAARLLTEARALAPLAEQDRYIYFRALEKAFTAALDEDAQALAGAAGGVSGDPGEPEPDDR